MYLNKSDRVEIIENAVTYIVVFAMLAYGVGKVVQFNHSAHVTSKVSDLTGMQLMWAFYGYSYPFVITLGVLEVLGGILMFFRKTRLIGCVFVSTILSNVILQDIYYDVNVGALKAAIVYQLCIFIIFWFNIDKIKLALSTLTSYITIPQTKSKRFLKFGLAVFLFVILRIFEYYVTIKWGSIQSDSETLKSQIQQIVSNKKAIVGVSIIGNKGKDTISLNGDRHFPMQSVFKFHIALAVLAEVDKGNLSINQKVEIKKEDLLPADFWSPLRDEHPNGGVFTIAELIQYSVSHSDNTACDELIRLIGTPKTVETYFKKNNINDIQITYNEEQMQAKWENMFLNWTTPKAASATLKMFYENKNNLLSKESYDFFWKTNFETTTGKKRIKGLLPEGTVVAHKTGWSGTNKETGITEAVNNIGIVFLPNGEYFIISVFVSASKENFDANEKIIAEIAKATYDFYLKKS